MLAELDKDYRRQKPIVFLGWEPHPMNTMYKIAYLTGGDDTFGPDFGAATVYTNVRAGYAQDCPNVVALLQGEKFSLSGEDEMMNYIINRRMSPATAAAVWARHHKDEVEPWLDGRDDARRQARLAGGAGAAVTGRTTIAATQSAAAAPIFSARCGRLGRRRGASQCCSRPR